MRGWAVKKLATGRTRGGQGPSAEFPPEAGRYLPLSSRAIGRQADPPYTTTAPGRGGHSQGGCAVTMAETERERNGIHRNDR